MRAREPRESTRLVVFDLDGTLADTTRDIANAVNRALGAHGLPRREVEEVRSFLGAGARRLVELAFDTRDTATVDRGLELFASCYAEDLVVETRPFDGIPALLADLTASGRTVAVLSNKPHHLTGRVISELFGTVPWSHVIGHRPGHARKPDPAVLLEVCRELDVRPEECALVGDTHFDVRTAVAAGAAAIGVTWGGTGAEELYDHGANFVARGPREIAHWLSDGRRRRNDGRAGRSGHV